LSKDRNEQFQQQGQKKIYNWKIHGFQQNK
jgi:hypothetical protein